MIFKNMLYLTDAYKLGHHEQYPQGTEKVISNFTARSSKLYNQKGKFYNEEVVFFGLQYYLERLNKYWDDYFFNLPLEEVLLEWKRIVSIMAGVPKHDIKTDHIKELHELGRLPLKIKALPEGSRVPIGVPMLTVENTVPSAYWLTNYIETDLSNSLWKMCTVATIANDFYKSLSFYDRETGGNGDFVPFQGHDFSYRGLSGETDACLTGASHATSFVGSDNIPSLSFLEHYYDANADKELIITSVPATEHSVMCAGGQESEIDTFKRLITDVYPNGVISIVSDTWDFWKVITQYTVKLKDIIKNRKPNELGLAKVVFRPDSGNPVDIVCGDLNAKPGTPEYKGAIECLWDVFGGIENKKGYKELDPSVGLIYGDGITLTRAEEILEKLKQKGFASSNIVFGIGSYSYQYNSRDTFGFAVKSTYVKINGKGLEIFKDPVTDDGVKKSLKGLPVVKRTNGTAGITSQMYYVVDQQSEESYDGGELKTVFNNGDIVKRTNLQTIRENLNGN